jgi:DNA invertase Pin-like site-specific DNA recombinase
VRAIGYIRVSSKGQMDGDGPARQLDAIKKFCSAQNIGFTQYVTEEGVSGTVEAMDRAAFTDMLVMIEQSWKSPNPIGAVVVERLDRLARDLMVSEFLLKELRTRGIKVFSADQGALIDMANNEGDPTRKLIRQIIAALAEWEKSQLVVKLRVARERKKAATGRCEGPLPYGSTPSEAAILNSIKIWKRQKFSLNQIAEFLNQGDMKTRFGKKWNKKNVFNVLH